MSETKETLLEKIASKVSVDLAKMFKREIKLEKAKLKDGTVVEIEGEEIYVLAPQEDGEPERIPAPVGEHELEDGGVVVVQEEGVIAEIKKPEDMGKDEKEMDLASEVEQLKKDVEELKSYMKPKEEEMSKEEPKEEVKKETELKAETKDVEEPKKEEVELSAEEPKKITHSPEKQTKTNINLYAQNRVLTTKDKVYAKLFS